MANDDISILEKRRAQAEVIKPIYDVLVRELGVATARRFLNEAIRRAAEAEGQAFAVREGDAPSLRKFAQILPLWQRDDALTIEPLKATDSELDFNVTRCKFAEMYQEMGLGELGYLLSCVRDASFCVGYDPNIQLERSQTIMQGATRCDFRFKSTSPSP